MFELTTDATTREIFCWVPVVDVDLHPQPARATDC
jgi:hypothetical protein